MERKYNKMRKYKVWQGIKNTYLLDIGSSWKGEFPSLNVEGHVRHLANVITADNILKAGGGREGMKRDGRLSECGSIVQLSCVLLNMKPRESHQVSQQVFFCTYNTVLVACTHQTIDVVHALLRSNNERGASVNDSLTTTHASNNLTIDSNTEQETQHSIH